MDYSTLVADKDTPGSIKYWANWNRLDAVGILDEAQKFIYGKLRLQIMITEEPVAIALDATTVALPDRYLDPLHLGIPGYINRIKYWDMERFKKRLAYDETATLPVAIPTVWTRQGNMMLFNSKSDAAYTARFSFFQRPDALEATTNEENWLTDRYPTLLRRACLMYVYEELKNSTERQSAEISALAMVDDIKKEGDLELRGMGLDFNWQDDEDD